MSRERVRNKDVFTPYSRPDSGVFTLYICPDGHEFEVMRTATKKFYGYIPPQELCMNKTCNYYAKLERVFEK